MEDDSYQYQSKHGSKGKRMVASEASQHVIFLGLDPDYVESDVSMQLLMKMDYAPTLSQMLQFLRSYDLVVENVTIIRDRTTGISIFHTR